MEKGHNRLLVGRFRYAQGVAESFPKCTTPSFICGIGDRGFQSCIPSRSTESGGRPEACALKGRLRVRAKDQAHRHSFLTETALHRRAACLRTTGFSMEDV